MSAQTVLIADDDAQIRELLELYLVKEGFAVEQAADGAEAILKAQQLKPDLIVLDIMMPVLDGIETCRQIRNLAATPVILLTARTAAEDKLTGFECGADDYVVKPFSPGEVVARVQAILRRIDPAPAGQPPAPATPTFSYGDLSIDEASRTVKIGPDEIELTAKEFNLLYLLAAHPGRIYTREALLSSLWSYDAAGDNRTVDVHVQRLRNKLRRNPCSGWRIATVWGVGYRFDPDTRQGPES